MKILIKKSNQQIVSFSEDVFEYDENLFDMIDTDEPKEKLEAGNPMTFKDGKVVYEYRKNSPEMINERAKKIDKIKKATKLDDIKDILIEIL